MMLLVLVVKVICPPVSISVTIHVGIFTLMKGALQVAGLLLTEVLGDHRSVDSIISSALCYVGFFFFNRILSEVSKVGLL